jgi:hypothetical protein
MSDLDRLREELKKEEASLATPQAIPDDPEFDAELAVAFDGIEPDDAYIDAIFALPVNAYPTPSTSIASVLESVRTQGPVVALAALREEHGLSRPAAATILDVNVETLDRLEARIGLGWLNVAANKVRVYLQQLDLSPALLVRSIASQMPQGPSQVYAYRPRVMAEEPVTVEGSEDDLARLIAWGHELYQ